MKIDGRRQEIAQAVASEETRHAAYEAPQVLQLGQANDLIRGNASISTWDHIQGGPYQWWLSGE